MVGLCTEFLLAESWEGRVSERESVPTYQVLKES